MTFASPADKDALIRTCFGEARGEPDEGVAAVAHVILTRADWNPPSWWGQTIYGVCHRPWQFSCWNGGPDYDAVMALRENDPQYQRIAQIASDVLGGRTPDPANGATHYKVTGTPAEWDKSAAHVPEIIIGRHSFFKLGPSA